MKDNIKVASLNVKLKDLFRKWLEITKPFHKLSNQHQDILALLLYHHYVLKREITNEKILWKMVFDYDTKLKIKQELDIKDNLLQNVLSKLRNKKVITDGKISPVYIPNLKQKSKNFRILYNFNIMDNE